MSKTIPISRRLAAATAALLLSLVLLSFDTVEAQIAGSTRVDSEAKTQPRKPGEQRADPRRRPETRSNLDVQAIAKRQNDLIAKAIAGLTPRTPGESNVYLISAAASAEQDVFIREATAARNILDERLGTKGRSLLMINHASTVQTAPLFSIANLDQALRGLSNVMDREEDVLILFLTSHGNPGILNISFPSFALRDIEARQLSTLLKLSKIKHKIIIISACFSGSFIPALKDDYTLIMTASRSDRSSFGCSNEREWTYFGDAYFSRALKETRSLTKAFEEAKRTIGTWEREQRFTASEPQIYIGPRIQEKLEEIERRAETLPLPKAPI